MKHDEWCELVGSLMRYWQGCRCGSRAYARDPLPEDRDAVVTTRRENAIPRAIEA